MILGHLASIIHIKDAPVVLNQALTSRALLTSDISCITSAENFADVYYGGFVKSASGWLAANNPDVKGCYWVLQAPIGAVIEVSVLYLYTNDYRDAGRCAGSYLSVSYYTRVSQT